MHHCCEAIPRIFPPLNGEALDQLTKEESEKLVDMDRVVKQALERVQDSGIIFLDEVDKIALSSGRGAGGQGPDVSRGGTSRSGCPQMWRRLRDVADTLTGDLQEEVSASPIR